MVFSSPVFLFGFLPIVLLVYYLSPKTMRNVTLLLFSLMFYAWGEVFYVVVMIVSIVLNYIVGRLIGKSYVNYCCRKLWVTIGVIINLLILISFKYVNFIVDNVDFVLSQGNISTIEISPIHLPLGISFFTFQAISYIVDVYRKDVPAQKKIVNLALYISLFPQLIAGPIVRYHDVSLQIISRFTSLIKFESGVQRFIYGLAKKMLIANPLGEVVDSIFILTGNDLTMPLAWIGILAYTLQIFFDFSGYSDMAIGLGRMFGFIFRENFNYPYVSTSLREFWRRWHISLSSWFRDYLYIPLGGNRVSTIRVYMNLLFVFILTGFWHGASWNFMVWGVLHGVFLACEHAGLSDILKRVWKPLQHVYLLLIVMVGWVFFRAESLSYALNYLYSMSDVGNFHTTPLQFAQVLSYEAVYSFIVGVIISTPVYSKLKSFIGNISAENNNKTNLLIGTPKLIIIFALLFLSILKVASSTYNPFIYYRF